MNTPLILPARPGDPLAEMLAHFCTLDPLASSPIETALQAPLLGVGDFLNVSGEAGCGKTMFAADVILAWAHPGRQGAALGGLLQFNPIYRCDGNVGIIDAENAPPRWQSLLLRKMRAEGLDPHDLRGTIQYVRPSEIGLQVATQWKSRSELLAAALAANGVRLAIVDSLGRTWSPDDLNSTAWVQQGLAPFRAACQTQGIAVLALTHTRRSRSRDDIDAVGPLGSSLQEAQVDAQIMMTIDKDGRGCHLRLRKSRRAYWIRPGSTIALRFTHELGYRPQDGWESIWPHECPDDSGDPDDHPGIRLQILKLLEDSPGTLKSTAIAAQLGCTPRTVTTHLRALEATNRVERLGRGPSQEWRLRS